MEDCKENMSKKRVRDDSDVNSPESKRNKYTAELVKDDSAELDRLEFKESELNSPVSTHIGHDFVDILDDTDGDTVPVIHDLDSVIKSFEEEILKSSGPPAAAAALELTSYDSGDSQPELGYLLGASDDELGLPPAGSLAADEIPNNEAVNLVPISAEVVGIGDGLGMDDQNQMPCFDSFDFGLTGEYHNGGSDAGEFLTLGGLFDFPEQAASSEFSWRAESLPAL